MIRRRALLSMLIAMMAGFYALGASRAAWACAASENLACATPGVDCERVMCPDDCALACVALTSASRGFAMPFMSSAITSSEVAKFQFALHAGPEPPPPRSGFNPLIETPYSWRMS